MCKSVANERMAICLQALRNQTEPLQAWRSISGPMLLDDGLSNSGAIDAVLSRGEDLDAYIAIPRISEMGFA